MITLIFEGKLMFAVNQQLVGRAIEEWDKRGSGSYACYLLKFAHCYWVEVGRWN